MWRSDLNLHHVRWGKMLGWRDNHSVFSTAQAGSKSCQIQLWPMKMKLWGLEQERHLLKATPPVSRNHHMSCNVLMRNQQSMGVRMMLGVPWHQTDPWQMTWRGHAGRKLTTQRVSVSRVVLIASRSLTYNRIASHERSSFKRSYCRLVQHTQSVWGSNHITKWISYLRKNLIHTSVRMSLTSSVQDQIHGPLTAQEMMTCKQSELGTTPSYSVLISASLQATT